MTYNGNEADFRSSYAEVKFLFMKFISCTCMQKWSDFEEGTFGSHFIGRLMATSGELPWGMLEIKVAGGISSRPFPSGVNLAFERLSLNKNWVELNCSNYPNYSIIIPLERLFCH